MEVSSNYQFNFFDKNSEKIESVIVRWSGISYRNSGGELSPIEVISISNENEIEFKFICADTRDTVIEETDLLFIDTLHNYVQLKKELELHSSKVKKYLIFHDTTTFESNGESYTGEKEIGLWPAIEEFLQQNFNWTIHERFINNNGLTILKNETK